MKLLLLKARNVLSSLELDEYFARGRTERLPTARPRTCGSVAMLLAALRQKQLARLPQM